MSFELTGWIIPIIVIIFFFSIIIVRNRERYYLIVKKYWFFEPSMFSKIRLITFIVGFGLLLISILDLRGPEERIKATIPDQKTIIIIDSSASMLAEDVRPNRFQRSLFLARHFIKRAAGHQIAVVLFSDTQKRLVPFTDDIDLLDARVAALEKTDLKYGNSNINQAVKESLQYFKIDNDSEEIVGNILLFTDSEEHGGVFSLGEGNDVNLAVVGVGTAAGAPIPMRSKSGVFSDYKKYKGEKVISKLDENAIKSMGNDFKNFKYWVATSYIIPTDEILTFFRGIYKKKLGETDIRVRPVYGHIIVLVAILFYFVSSLFGLGKTISKPLIALCLISLLFGGIDLQAQEESPVESLELTQQKRKLKSGKTTVDETKFIAQELLRSGKVKEASVLYDEINKRNSKDINALANMGTAYAADGNLGKALESYERALNMAPEGQDRDQLKKLVRNNTLLAIKKKKQKSKSKGKKGKKKDKKNKKKNEKNKKEDSKDGDSKNESKDSKPQDKGDDKKSKSKPKDRDEEKKKKEEQKKRDQEEQKKQSKPSTLEEKEEQIKQKRKMVKIPAMLKQIMDQDRSLQEKYYKTNSKRKRRNQKRRDW